MHAWHALAYGAKILSGRKCQHAALAQAFCEEGEQLVGFTCIGTPTRAREARELDNAQARLSDWPGPG